jgi:putative phosphoribosyl transferase
MIFKDREEAGEKLSEKLLQDKTLLKNKRNIIIVSLLRGGVVVGKIIAEKLKVEHIPLAVTKIPAPHNQELAIGAVCFDISYLQENVIKNLCLEKEEIQKQIFYAQTKNRKYVKQFRLSERSAKKRLENKTAILVDDGIATGATMRAAFLFVKTKKAKEIILAVPVAPIDFDTKEFDETIILHKDPFFSSVSQFYGHFSQIETI